MLKTTNELFLSKRVFQLEEAIRIHRSQKADDRCIEDDDRLYAVLEDGIKCDRRVGCKEDMLKNCQRFIENRCEGGEWPSYAELESKLNEAKRLLERYYNKTRTKNYYGDGGPSLTMDVEAFLNE